MSATTFLAGRVTLHGGDCLAILKTLPDASVDSVVTDPPYHLTSIVKRFGGENAAPAKARQTGAFTRASRGFMGKVWDGGDIAFQVELWAEVLRVLKPGGHLAAFSGTRTYHRMAVAIEDAGFEIRDQLAWTYGSGFPKSHDVSKAMDKAAGAERRIVSEKVNRASFDENGEGGGGFQRGTIIVSEPASDAARQWQGWGSALKPAWEPICLARKPLDGTIAANVLAHGVGALNIDGCRVGSDERTNGPASPTSMQRKSRVTAGYRSDAGLGPGAPASTVVGRFPSNLIHDGSPEVLAAFPQAPGQQQDVMPDAPSAKTGNVYGQMNRHGEKSADARYADRGSTNFAALPSARRGNTGSAARFFYTAKADADDRIGSKHPTVKPVDLMQWLVRLITPKGGTVLDLFAGTGTTGEAAWREGCSAVLIEREAEYQADIARRMAMVLSGPDERKRRMAALKPAADAGPLFGGEAA